MKLSLAVAVTVAGLACSQQQSTSSTSTTTSATGVVTDPAATAAVVLDAAECQSLTPGQKPWLSGDYAGYERFAIACPVHRPGEAPALYVLSVDALTVERSLPVDAPAPRLPKAILVLPEGRVVGQLRTAYPADPPVSIDLTFSEWMDALPRQVAVAVEDPAVSGGRRLPSLRWSDSLRRYLEQDVPDGH